MMAGPLTTDVVPTGTIKLTDWIEDDADGLGRRYASELRRNYRWHGGKLLKPAVPNLPN